MRNFSGITTTKDLTIDLSTSAVWTYQTETFAVDTESSVATIGIGNHWLLDWGLWIGGDWVLASTALGQTSEATLTSSTGTVSAANSATFKKDNENIGDLLEWEKINLDLLFVLSYNHYIYFIAKSIITS